MIWLIFHVIHIERWVNYILSCQHSSVSTHSKLRSRTIRACPHPCNLSPTVCKPIHCSVLSVIDKRMMSTMICILTTCWLMDRHWNSTIATFVSFFIVLAWAKLESSRGIFTTVCLFAGIFYDKIVICEAQSCRLEIRSCLILTLDVLCLSVWHLPLCGIVLLLVHFGGLFLLGRKLRKVRLSFMLLLPRQIGRHQLALGCVVIGSSGPIQNLSYGLTLVWVHGVKAGSPDHSDAFVHQLGGTEVHLFILSVCNHRMRFALIRFRTCRAAHTAFCSCVTAGVIFPFYAFGWRAVVRLLVVLF